MEKDIINKGDLILLVSKNKIYLLKAGAEINTDIGKINTSEVIGKRFYSNIKSSKNINFTIIKPTIIDFLKHASRGPQIISLKDASALLGAIGISPGWNVLDAGTGSGFLAIFLANIIYPGQIITYEKRKEFYEIAKKNIAKFGIKNIIIKNEDVFKAKEKNLDLITLDMEDSHKFVKYAYEMLKIGGWLAVYSLHIEQIQRVFIEMRKFEFQEIRIFETIQRDWQIEGENKTFTRPKTKMLGHTGFWIVGRKV
ncbi:MAG: tRNA (adenine-N1)-methyltransferase [Candidatus Aenigmatarchaeota archaeon]